MIAKNLFDIGFWFSRDFCNIANDIAALPFFPVQILKTFCFEHDLIYFPLDQSSLPLPSSLYWFENQSKCVNNLSFFHLADKKPSGKSKDEQMAEKKQELEKRLQDVTGQLGASKKTAKKGMYTRLRHGEHAMTMEYTLEFITYLLLPVAIFCTYSFNSTILIP